MLSVPGAGGGSRESGEFGPKGPGADAGGTDWKRLIQPLGQGTYEVLPLLRWLRQANYTGPIGLQHYGIPGDAAENLKHSLEAWRKLSAAAAKEPAP